MDDDVYVNLNRDYRYPLTRDLLAFWWVRIGDRVGRFYARLCAGQDLDDLRRLAIRARERNEIDWIK